MESKNPEKHEAYWVFENHGDGQSKLGYIAHAESPREAVQEYIDQRVQSGARSKIARMLNVVRVDDISMYDIDATIKVTERTDD